MEYFCSICYKFHNQGKITLSCSDKHTVCQEAYNKLKEYHIHVCPICRQPFIDKAISDAFVLDLINHESYSSRS